jgi:hypothetical protein
MGPRTAHHAFELGAGQGDLEVSIRQEDRDGGFGVV